MYVDESWARRASHLSYSRTEWMTLSTNCVVGELGEQLSELTLARAINVLTEYITELAAVHREFSFNFSIQKTKAPSPTRPLRPPAGPNTLSIYALAHTHRPLGRNRICIFYICVQYTQLHTHTHTRVCAHMSYCMCACELTYLYLCMSRRLFETRFLCVLFSLKIENSRGCS